MNESQSLGVKGENQAAEFLKKAGYTIRHTNWRSGKKELDIVAENSDYIVFVEVKTRNENYLDPPSKTLNRDKRNSIIFAAEWYVKIYNIDKESRFDLITVIEKNEKLEIEHIEGAFYPTLR